MDPSRSSASSNLDAFLATRAAFYRRYGITIEAMRRLVRDLQNGWRPGKIGRPRIIREKPCATNSAT